MTRRLLISAVMLAAAPAIAQTGGDAQLTAADQVLASADMIGPEGNTVGPVALVETPNGVLIQLELEGLPPGMHAVHIHETGLCEPPGFESAGNHFNPASTEHGFLNPEGTHAGDLPNIHVGPDGVLQGDMLAQQVTLEEGADTSLLKEGGTALVIHSTLDDYETDPAGASGDRIACGVIERQ